jgi:hypothetical protein
VVYTPIVLDLPSGDNPAQLQARKHIQTSSTEWGTYFNLANLVTKDSVDSEGRLLSSVSDVHHKTAWLGGKPEKADYSIVFNQNGSKEVYVNRAYDGFLVVPEIEKDQKGQELYCPDESPKYRVNRGRDLFGSYGVKDGKTIEFENGFAKLREFVNHSQTSYLKDCTPTSGPLTADQVKRRYFGVWDTLAYDLVKVWMDSNRNGVVDCGEIKSLRESKVAAINTCNLMMTKNEQGQIVSLKDIYGNETHLRAAFLVSDRSDLQLSEGETLQRIMTGVKSSEEDAEFRVAIDILFKTDKDHYLDDLDSASLVELK